MARVTLLFSFLLAIPVWASVQPNQNTHFAMMQIGVVLFDRVENLRELSHPCNLPRSTERMAEWQDQVLSQAANLTDFGPYEEQVDVLVRVVQSELAALLRGAPLSSQNIIQLQRVLKFLEDHGTWTFRQDFSRAIQDHQLIRNENFREQIAPMLPITLNAMVRAGRYNLLEYLMRGLTTLEQGLQWERTNAELSDEPMNTFFPVRISVTLPHPDASQCRRLIFEPLQ